MLFEKENRKMTIVELFQVKISSYRVYLTATTRNGTSEHRQLDTADSGQLDSWQQLTLGARKARLYSWAVADIRPCFIPFRGRHIK